MHVEDMWLEKALLDPVIGPRLQRLKLKGGHFEIFQRKAPEEKERWRTFLARGDRGGVLGVLNLDTGFVLDEEHPSVLGVYVDRKYRRRGIGTYLVYSARYQYPDHDFFVKPWSRISSEFFQRVDHVLQPNQRSVG